VKALWVIFEGWLIREGDGMVASHGQLSCAALGFEKARPNVFQKEKLKINLILMDGKLCFEDNGNF
jgi:hypothetical protein